MSAEIVNIRDFKRPEEKVAEIKRFADRLIDLGDRIRASQANVYDTAPCEMPPAQPDFSDRDPA